MELWPLSLVTPLNGNYDLPPNESVLPSPSKLFVPLVVDCVFIVFRTFAKTASSSIFSSQVSSATMSFSHFS